MTISAELEAKILRFYHVEKWRCGTIARQLHVHRGTVQRVLAQAGLPRVGGVQRPSQIEPFLPFIHDTLKKFPSLTASRLYAMVRERGYKGAPDHFRHLISLHRPRPPAEAYLRLRTLPGEQSQVDWAHFGHLQIGRASRPLMAFVMVLSWSRQIWLKFFLDARMDSFLLGHVGAFEAWCGSARVLLYDNLKSAVLERQGDAIRFNPQLLEFASHYRFEPRPVAVRRGNEKGRVERAIRFVRSSFFAARKFTDIDDLNAQAAQWCATVAADRPCPDEPDITVREAFEREKGSLLALPDNPYECDLQEPASVGKTPYVRFDLNDYSVPADYVRRTLTVRADPHRVRILDGADVVAEHVRSYDRGQQVENPAHIDELVQRKRAARQHRGLDHLAHAAPASRALMLRAAEVGGNIGNITTQLLRLLDCYGALELQAAIEETLASDAAPHPNPVREALERRRIARQAPPPVSLNLPEHIRSKDAVVTPHRLEIYDQLTGGHDDDKHD
ncbi:IS21 family transposase [Paraburkholderia guartelaensis]|uniref:IS21 family transposase n=1 Tax=Paraburkholderia guartelaensis TaxID=2546446 RepID=UPI002AB5F0A7|nr:IS21 family transposase [Paraburkholderia guartelaensis]